ncbi:hypothetical protein HYH03_002867 [Edaphochlamys debaryana]|uniref:Methanethiol oxidase n=1 Tax=Edaphochlamys debaryana TaxID=47281 RepID=A0A835YCP7_9CHLO|nr:hypothetical protein HYH03_002867 [Edaphochlamys debaryana]|eukprot:KAG2499289.1 hypothetical protein HYH03_002867 [Edaphochlamys debaryana]
MSGEAKCCKHGPGYASPQDAYKNGPREKLLYVTAIVADQSRPDYLSTVDVDPESPSYGQVIHRLPMPHKGDELHHSGWNSCSSCFLDPSAPKRKLLVLPTLESGRVYGVDVLTDPRAPKLVAVTEAEEILAKTGVRTLHTSHCAPDGFIMISALGDQEDEGKGAFLLLNQDLSIRGKWSSTEVEYNYDFWYQPRLNVMVSTAWGAPRFFKQGFNPAEVADHYGHSLYVWDWKKHSLKQKIDLGDKGLIPLEVRFLHEPSAPHAYVGCALSSSVVHLTRLDGAGLDAPWVANVVIEQPWVKVEGWVLPELPPLVTDILVAMDDRFLFISNWLRGDLSQYDISDRANPKLVGRVWLGGVVRKGSSVKILGGMPEDQPDAPSIPTVKGVELRGGPQMFQLSLDGKRIYVTNSLFSPWDKQFYPDLWHKGSHLLKVDVDTVNGGLTLDTDFIVDYGKEPDGPALAHEVRYPGGDCSSDIWI